MWLEIVMFAHDLIVWTQTLCLDGEVAKAEPKRRASELLDPFQHLKTLAPMTA